MLSWCLGLGLAVTPTTGGTRPEVSITLPKELEPELHDVARQIVRAHFMDVAVVVVLRTAAPEDDRPVADPAKSPLPLALLWFEQEEGSLLLLAQELETGRMYQRRVPTGNGLSVESWELAVVVAREVVLGLLERHELSRARATAAVPPEPARQRGRLRLAVAYVGSKYAREVAWASGGRLELGWEFRNHLTVAASGSVWAPVEVHSHDVRLRVTRFPVEAAVGYRVEWDRIALNPELWTGFEVVRRQASIQRVDPPVTAKALHYPFVVGGRVRLAYRPSRKVPLWFVAAVGASVRVTPTRWHIDTGSAVVSPLTEARAAPDVLAGAQLSL